MNEPQSIAAEKIALSILAGENEFGQPLCRPNDLIPLSYGDTTLWPVAPTSSLFSYQVPNGQAMLWTYSSLYTTLADESETAVNFGFNFNTYCFLTIQGASGNFQPRTGSILTQTIFNKPILLVFDSLTTPRIILNPSGSTQSVGNLRVEAEVMAYLIPSGLASAFRDHQTRFS